MVNISKAVAFLAFEIKDNITTHRLVIDVSKPNLLTVSTLGKSCIILKDKKKWLEIESNELEANCLSNCLSEAIRVSCQRGRGGYVVKTNYPVKVFRPT